jgi:hypothetical protein
MLFYGSPDGILVRKPLVLAEVEEAEDDDHAQLIGALQQPPVSG